MKKTYIDLIIICAFILFFITGIIIYAYYSGSCQLRKLNYNCFKDFCLIKEFSINLPNKLKKSIHQLLLNKSIQKHVSIRMYPETIFNCALPNKSGTTISTQNIIKYAPQLIHYYQNDLCKFISKQIKISLHPTQLQYPTSCALLIYEKENDWINWHYDYNYYKGRFFTVLIPLTHDKTCTEFQFKDQENQIKSVQLIGNNAVCFEGNFLYHRASKLCKNQRRVILSCQYVTTNEMSFLNNLRIKIKDFAYTGKLLPSS